MNEQVEIQHDTGTSKKLTFIMAISHVTKVLDDKDTKSNEFHHEITDLTVFGQSNKYVVDKLEKM